jgi:hypothetical protein
MASKGGETANRLGIAILANCDKQLARTYIDAGRMRLQDGLIPRTVYWIFSPLAPPRTGRMPKARMKIKLPIEIVVNADERHHTSIRQTLDPRSSSGF